MEKSLLRSNRQPEAVGMIVIIGLAAIGIIGWVLPIDKDITMQRGVVQCNANFAGDGPGCHGTITFPKPFSQTPTSYGINIDCLSNTALNLASQNATQICQTAANAGQVGHTVDNFVPSGSITLFGGNFTWKNWKSGSPGGTPCITQAGSQNNNCDVGASTLGAQQSGIGIQLIFTCVTVAGVQTGNEWMALQYTTDLSTWVNSGINDTDPGSLCTILPAFISESSIVVLHNITPLGFRVIGGGGSGAGDNITFFSIAVELSVQNSILMVSNMGPVNVGITLDTKTQFPFYVQFHNTAFPAENPVMTWWACVC